MYHIEIVFLIIILIMVAINCYYYLQYNDFFGIMVGTWRGTCNSIILIVIFIDVAFRWFMYSDEIVNWLFS